MTQDSRTTIRLTCTGIALAALLALTACNKADETPGEKLDNAIERSEQVASDAATSTGNALENAGQSIREGADAAGQAASEAATSAAIAIDDAGITARINAELAKDNELSALAINVDTHSGAVTLNGKAPNADAKARAEMLAKSVEGVTSVNNLLVVE